VRQDLCSALVADYFLWVVREALTRMKIHNMVKRWTKIT
jgi:hypothetical protein